MTTPLRLRPEDNEMLDELASGLGVSREQVVARLIHAASERRKDKEFTRATLDDLNLERKDLLDRLAQ